MGQDLATLKAELSTVIGGFVWAPGRVVFDDPSSISDSNARVMQQALFRRLERLETELLIESAYFIPLARGVGRARGLVDRGVRVRVVTNSLASNDILAAFTGYSISPKVLIRAGVELHEVRWDDRVRSQGRLHRQLQPGRSLAYHQHRGRSHWDADPLTTRWKCFKARLLSIRPIIEQL